MTTIDYGYDGLSRLLTANYNGGAVEYTYGYDVAGNLVNNNGVTRTYNAANQMVNDGTNTLTYDANGNLTNDGVNSLTWDRANRMLTAPGSTLYKYDGLGNRIQQTILGTPNVVTDYLNDVQPGLVKLLRQDDGSNVDHFVHAVRGIHSVGDGTDWTWYAQDGLGSVRGLVDASGDVISSQSYNPIGVPDTDYGAGFGFTGEQTDANDLLYLRARYYAPSKGVFTALDPFEGMQTRPLSLNGYSWVEGNVPNMIDATGSCPENPGQWDFFGRRCVELAEGLSQRHNIPLENLLNLSYFELERLTLANTVVDFAMGSRQRLEDSAIIPNLAATDPVATLQSLWQFTCQSDSLTNKLLGVSGILIVLEGEATKRIFEGARYAVYATVGANVARLSYPVPTTAGVSATGTAAPASGGAALGYAGGVVGGISVGYGVASGVDDFLDFTDSILFAMQSQSNAGTGSGQQTWGTCDENQYNPLKNAMELACKSEGVLTSCSENSLKKLKQRLRQPGQKIKDVVITRQHIQEIINNNLACEAARQAIQNTCYANSPDPSHTNEIQQTQTNRAGCTTLLNTLPT